MRPGTEHAPVSYTILPASIRTRRRNSHGHIPVFSLAQKRVGIGILPIPRPGRCHVPGLQRVIGKPNYLWSPALTNTRTVIIKIVYPASPTLIPTPVTAPAHRSLPYQ